MRVWGAVCGAKGAAGVADALVGGAALLETSLRRERRAGGSRLRGEPILAVLLRGRIFRTRTALRPDESGAMAQADWAGRDGEAAGGDDRGGATSAGTEAK